ncbi:hypothetical protein [Streptomyces sp. NPDC088184]|uniref:hypothetical protein n=1 Tax=unclassified Streptomyces TaxID=2593676 RepID=UPI003437090C
MGAQEAARRLPPQEHAERPELALVKERIEEEADRGKVAAMCADLGAYLPTPRNLRVLLAGVGEGSAVLLGRGWAWIRGDEGWNSDSAMKAGGIVFVAHAVGKSALSSLGSYTGYLIPPGIVTWCLVARQYTELAVAVRAATKEAKAAERERLLKEAREEIAATAKKAAEARTEAKRRVQEDQADAGAEENAAVEAAVDGGQDEDAEELTVDEIAAIVRRVAARHPRHLGVHLSDLLPEPELAGWEQAELKAALKDDWNLPVSSFKLTFPGGLARGREGVRLEHLPPAPAPPAGAAGGRAPAGVGEGLVLVPSQPSAGAPASTPPGAAPGAVPGVASEAAVSPSPTPTPTPSQGAR